MKVNINIPGLDELGDKAREVARNVVETPVPLGKTVGATTLGYVIVQLLVLRRMGVTLIISRGKHRL